MDLPPFFKLHAYDVVGSTNVEARKLAEAGAEEGTIAWAKRQEQGVGRRGRQWISPEGNLYCSLILRPDCEPTEAARLSFLVALGLHDAIAPLLPRAQSLGLKWPNDVLIDGHKTAGILLESKTRFDGKMDYVIVGTGINIATFPDRTDGLPATSLSAAGAKVGVGDVLSAYGYALLALYMIWKREGFAPIRDRWLNHATGIGERITARLSNETLDGLFLGLDENGALILELDTGEKKRITAGEIFFAPASGQ